MMNVVQGRHVCLYNMTFICELYSLKVIFLPIENHRTIFAMQISGKYDFRCEMYMNSSVFEVFHLMDIDNDGHLTKTDLLTVTMNQLKVYCVFTVTNREGVKTETNLRYFVVQYLGK